MPTRRGKRRPPNDAIAFLWGDRRLNVDALEAMLGDFGSPEMLLTVAAQHEVCADWCAKQGQAGRAAVFRAAAAAIRERWRNG